MSFWSKSDRLSDRRTFLRTVGTTGIVTIAGCTGDDGDATTEATVDDDDSNDTNDEDDDTQSDDGNDTADQTDQSTVPEPLTSVNFEGSWFDSHAHWGNAEFFDGEDFVIDDYTAVLREYDIGASVLFVMAQYWERDYDSLVESLAVDDVDYLPFMGPGRQIQSVYESREEMFYGIGEIPFYEGTPQFGLSFSDEPIATFIEFASANDLVLMLHPTMAQAADIEATLSTRPDLQLLLHGQELTGTDFLLDVLETYDNCFFSFDIGSQLGPIFLQSNSASGFIDQFENERSWYLEEMTKNLSPMLEAAPDRVMWGTDIIVDWHVDPAFYEVIMEFSADLRDSISTQYRDGYAYENAVSLFGGE